MGRRCARLQSWGRLPWHPPSCAPHTCSVWGQWWVRVAPSPPCFQQGEGWGVGSADNGLPGIHDSAQHWVPGDSRHNPLPGALARCSPCGIHGGGPARGAGGRGEPSPEGSGGLGEVGGLRPGRGPHCRGLPPPGRIRGGWRAPTSPFLGWNAFPWGRHGALLRHHLRAGVRELGCGGVALGRESTWEGGILGQ